MNYLHATPVADGLCRNCGVQLARTDPSGYACVYCSPHLFPRPAMSAAADTAELDRLRAENKRMREAIERTAETLRTEARSLVVEPVRGVRVSSVMTALASNLREALKVRP